MCYELTRPIPMRNEAHEFHTFSGQPGNDFRAASTHTCFSLHKCVSQAVPELVSGVPAEKNTIINDVYEDLFVCTHKETLNAILVRLGKAIIKASQNSIIHISAKPIGNILLVHFKSNHAHHSQELTQSLQQTEALAERLGGCITISHNGKYGMDLAFTFVNH
ncbi:MAG: hypothetical protein JNN00_05210 [Chitinophagaceae bacterium]|nr:hypothetical protein [Chitinophagaceae bacterium]